MAEGFGRGELWTLLCIYWDDKLLELGIKISDLKKQNIQFLFLLTVKTDEIS